MICVYNSKETIFENNGLVILDSPLSAIVEEELNGSYELELEYALDDRGKWEYLIEDNIIKADGQLFRIYHKTKKLTSIKINARHIFYDLIDNLLEDVRPTETTGYGALDWVLTHTQYPHKFISTGDVGEINTRYFIRVNPLEAIMGKEGIINTWGGEIVRDNFTIKLLQSRGLDRGVLVAYGKNIKEIDETLDIDSICTRLMPKGRDGLLLPEKYIDSSYINNYSHPKIKIQEFDIGIDEEKGITESIAIEQLREAAINYMKNNKIDIPEFNYKIDFIELSKTEEYKNYAVLERVYLGDTVTIKHSKLNINLKAKVIKIVKSLITNRIEKIELGSFKPNLATSINNSIQEVKQEIIQVKSDYQKAIENATSLITGSKGGNVVIRQNDNGNPYEILIMDTTDVNTAVNVWRWNMGGFGYSSTGINGPYGTAITMDGAIVADFITVGKLNASLITTGVLNANLIKAGILSSIDESVSINLQDGAFAIGGRSGDVAKHTGSYSEWKNSDGSLTRVDATGFYNKVGTSKREYHHLNYSTTFAMPSFSGSGSGYSTKWITLPEEFKNKRISASVSIAEATASYVPSTFGVIGSVGAYVQEIDKVNGKVLIYGFLNAYDVNNKTWHNLNERLTVNLTIVA